jgi:hypothetical protein
MIGSRPPPLSTPTAIKLPTAPSKCAGLFPCGRDQPSNLAARWVLFTWPTYILHKTYVGTCGGALILRLIAPQHCDLIDRPSIDGPSPGLPLATWSTKLTRSSHVAVTSRLGWCNKRQRLRTSPCGSATANPSRSTPHPAQAARAVLTAHSASAPASCGLLIASTFGASTATFAKIEPSAAPSMRLTLGRGTLTPIPRLPTISMTPGRPRRGARQLDSRDGRPSSPPPPRLGMDTRAQPPPNSTRDKADATQRSYAAATACPPGPTSTPRTPATQLSPLVGMPSLHPRTALRQELDLANWTPI